MADGGWIGKQAFQNGALAADSVGRSAMASNYVQTAHIADGQITYAKLANAVMVHVGVYDLSFYGMAVYG